MTHTLPKRTIRTTSPPRSGSGSGSGSGRERDREREPAGRDNRPRDPADLAATLRDLALCAHEAVKTADATGRADDLRDLKFALARLEADLHIQDLHRLVPYVHALRRQVASRLVLGEAGG